ncbi:hypothetical protein ZWY2020_057111 [Hordeum vulgare]|nr:hypothetical protein ZWY2020_057111 [Hordeum vulgare]
MASNANDARRDAQPGSRDAANLVRLRRIGRSEAGFDAAQRVEKGAANQVKSERTSLARLRPKDVGDAEGSARRRITERAKIVPLQPASDGCVEEDARINKRKADSLEVIHISDDETVVAVPPTKIKIKKKAAAGDSRGSGRGRGHEREESSAAKSAVAASSSQGNRCWLIAPSSPVPNRSLFTAPPASPVADDAGHLQDETSSVNEEESDASLGSDEVDETELYLLACVSEMIANDSDSDTRNNFANGEGTSEEGRTRNCTGELPVERDN